MRVPDVGGSIRVTMRASVDLPQPDSPTTASVARLDREGHAADGVQPRRLAEQAAPDRIDLDEVVGFDDGRAHDAISAPTR